MSSSSETMRSRLQQAGSACITGRQQGGSGNVSPAALAANLTAAKRSGGRSNSCGGGDSSGVAGVLSWASSIGDPYPQPSGRRRVAPENKALQGATANSMYGNRNEAGAIVDSGPMSTAYPGNNISLPLQPYARPMPSYHQLLQSKQEDGGPPAAIGNFQPSVRVSRPPGGVSTWSPGWGF